MKTLSLLIILLAQIAISRPAAADPLCAHVPGLIRHCLRAQIGETTAIPEGYELIDADFAPQGRQSRVALVRRTSDGRRFVFKTVTSGSLIHRVNLAKEVSRSRTWIALGLSKAQSFWSDDHSGLLKDYVEGPTAEALMKANPAFFSEPSRERLALSEFYRRAIASRHFIRDLQPGNLIFDGKEFQIVDSLRITPVESLEQSRSAYRMGLMRDLRFVPGTKYTEKTAWADDAERFINSLLDDCEAELIPSPD